MAKKKRLTPEEEMETLERKYVALQKDIDFGIDGRVREQTDADNKAIDEYETSIRDKEEKMREKGKNERQIKAATKRAWGKWHQMRLDAIDSYDSRHSFAEGYQKPARKVEQRDIERKYADILMKANLSPEEMKEVTILKKKIKKLRLAGDAIRHISTIIGATIGTALGIIGGLFVPFGSAVVSGIAATTGGVLVGGLGGSIGSLQAERGGTPPDTDERFSYKRFNEIADLHSQIYGTKDNENPYLTQAKQKLRDAAEKARQEQANSQAEPELN